MTGLAVTPISTTEAVVVSLREKILDGAIEPGAPLPEADLTREFGVARPTVRAAIQTLCHEGLLKRERNRSAFVPVLGHEDVRDLYGVRIPIECLIVDADVGAITVWCDPTGAITRGPKRGFGLARGETLEDD